jgi:hypothetical protein
MSIKKACTIALLMFVAASLVVLAAKSLREGSLAAKIENHGDRLIVYYFHGKARCPPCEKIETYAHEAVAGSFAAELSDGRIEWKAVDFEEPANEHFVKDFDLIASTVVLVEMRGGATKNWKNLQEVWNLLDDKPAFLEFVQKEVRAFLHESNGGR